MSDADLTAFDVLLKETVTAKRLSGSKVTELQKLAVKLLKHDTRLVSAMYKLHRSLRPQSQQKISSLYVFDGIARAARGVYAKAQKAGNEGSERGAAYALAFLGRVEAVLGGLVGDMCADGWTEGREKARKILNLWTSASTFPPATLERLQRVVVAAAAAADNGEGPSTHKEGGAASASAGGGSGAAVRPAAGTSGSDQPRKSASPDGYPTTPPPDAGQRSTTPPGPPPAHPNYGPAGTATAPSSSAPATSAAAPSLPSFLDPKLLENLASIAANASKLSALPLPISGQGQGPTPPHSAGTATPPVPPLPVARRAYAEPPRDPRLPPPRADPARLPASAQPSPAAQPVMSADAQMQAALARRDQIAAMMARSAGGAGGASGGHGAPPPSAPQYGQPAMHRSAPSASSAGPTPNSASWQSGTNGSQSSYSHQQDVRAQLNPRDVRAMGHAGPPPSLPPAPPGPPSAPPAKRPAGSSDLSDGEVEMDMEDSDDDAGLAVGRGGPNKRARVGPGAGAGGVQISLSAQGQSIAAAAAPAPSRSIVPALTAAPTAPPPPPPPAASTSGPDLDTFDVASFNPMDPASWAALGEAWRRSKCAEPTAQELMGFLMGSPAGMQAMMGGAGMMGAGMPGGMGAGMGMGAETGMGGGGGGGGGKWQQDDTHQQVRGSWDDGPYAQYGRGRGR